MSFHWQGGTERDATQAVLISRACDGSSLDGVLTLLNLHPKHSCKGLSGNLLERVNKEIKRSHNLVGIFAYDPAILRLFGSQLPGQQEE